MFLRQIVSNILNITKMPKSTGFFYAVKKGTKPGVYKTWPECQEQVVGFKAAQFKKFPTLEEAEAFVGIAGNQPDPTANPTNRLAKRAHHTSAGSSSSGDNIKKLKTEDKDLSGNFTGKPFLEEEGTHVYTDGGCFGNGQDGAKAGIGVYWADKDPDNVSERLTGRQTNNCAEINAGVSAVKVAKKKGIKNLILHTDSMFLINGITLWIKKWKKNGWVLGSGKPVINKVDFERLDEQLDDINVKWVYVKGHSGDPGNDAVDALAKAGASKPKPKSDQDDLDDSE